MNTKKMILTIFGFVAMLLLTMPTSQGRDTSFPIEISISATDEEIFVGEFAFYINWDCYGEHIVADVYKVFPENQKSYYYASYRGRKYMLVFSSRDNMYGNILYAINVGGTKYYMKMKEEN